MCDTVAFMCGMGTSQAVKVISRGCNLLKIRWPDLPMGDILHDATQFVAMCYVCTSSETMSSTRYELRISKTAQMKVTGASKLECIPQTSQTFEQNVRGRIYKCRCGKEY